MDPMRGLGEDGFHKRFNNLVASFFRFRNGQRTDGDKVVVQLCMAINAASSTTKGKGAAHIPPLVSIKQVIKSLSNFYVYFLFIKFFFLGQRKSWEGWSNLSSPCYCLLQGRESWVGPYCVWTRTILPDPQSHGSLRDLHAFDWMLLRLQHWIWRSLWTSCRNTQICAIGRPRRDSSFLAQRKAQSQEAAEETKGRKGWQTLQN